MMHNNRFVLFLALYISGQAAFAAPLGEDAARHLLNRTGFAASPAQIARFAVLEPPTAIDLILDNTLTQANSSAPTWVNEPLGPPYQKVEEEIAKKEAMRVQRENAIDLRAWWYQEMLTTPSPLTEKMTLFWHNHFVSSIQKIKSPQLMYQQNVLLRHHALGNFADLLHDIAKDPAMLIYLDGARNVKAAPNENFAREVMELFTLGEGHYAESDIRESARAYTGWSIDREGRYQYRPRTHDDGQKTIFGTTANFSGEQVLDLILAKQETSQFIVRKLWREFVSPEPDEAEVNRLAKILREQAYQIKPTLRAMLLSPKFYAPMNRGVLVKSPVELTIGTLQQFAVQPQEWRPLLTLNQQMGQDVFAPPNVKGWPGGDVWINSQTLALREQLLQRLLRGSRGVPAIDLKHWSQNCSMQCAQRTLLPLAMNPVPTGNDSAAVTEILRDARYQLK